MHINKETMAGEKQEADSKSIPQEPRRIGRRGFVKALFGAGAGAVIATKLGPVGSIVEPIAEGFLKAQTAEAKQELLTVTEYSVEDLRAAGDNHIVGLVALPDGQHIVSDEWDNADNLSLKDRGKLSLFALGAIQSETDPNLRAAFGRRSELEDVGVLWENGQSYEHGGRSIIAAQYDPDKRFIFTTEASPDQENQVVYYKFDRTTKEFTKLEGASVPRAVMQTPLQSTSGSGLLRSLGISPVRWGAVETIIDPGNNTISTSVLYANLGYARGRLVQFTDARNQDRLFLLIMILNLRIGLMAAMEHYLILSMAHLLAFNRRNHLIFIQVPYT